MKHVPSVDFLDQRQVLERSGRIRPGEQEISPCAVVHRANLDSGFAGAVEIATLAGHQRKRRDVAPGPVGGVAVEDGRVRAADAVNLQLVDRQPVAPPLVAFHCQTSA